jgi:hypothetical protein
MKADQKPFVSANDPISINFHLNHGAQITEDVVTDPLT